MSLSGRVAKSRANNWVDFVTVFWHVDCVRPMSLTAFTERYRKWCKRHGYNFSQSHVGNSLGPQLMAELGDVAQFTHRNAITAFAGAILGQTSPVRTKPTG